MNLLYTVILGSIDTLRPSYKMDGWRYICFTDMDFEPNGWEIMKITGDRLTAREYKINIHKFIDVEKSIYMDGSVQLTEHIDFPYFDYTSSTHTFRDCIYQEAKICIELKKDSEEKINRQIDRYRSEGYPEHNGLCQNGILFRRHTKEVNDFCEAWFEELKNNSVRDQLSFNYVAWKKNFMYHAFPDFPKQFKFYPHGSN